MLCALVEAAGAEVAGSAHLATTPRPCARFLDDLPGDPDLVLTTGGVSMGVYDTVKEVLTADGGVEFVKVAMRPGMPQGCGVVGRVAHPDVTLPGNPVSSFVVVPRLRAPGPAPAGGARPRRRRVVRGRGRIGWAAAPGKVELTRVVESAAGVRPSGGQGSHVLGALAGATALALVPADVDRVEPGTRLRCLPLLGQDRHVSTDPSAPGLTHVRADGTAHMVDVSGKAVTARRAAAAGRVLLSPAAVAALRDGVVPKGDALGVARVAGIQAVKRTPELIPLAHPVAVHAVEVDLVVVDDGVDISAVVRTADRTGIEMEALTAVAVAALALVDMVKAVDKHARITDVRVTAKSGGRSGDWEEGT